MTDFYSLTVSKNILLEGYKKHAGAALQKEVAPLLRQIIQVAQNSGTNDSAVIRRNISKYLKSSSGKKQIEKIAESILDKTLPKFFSVEAANIAGTGVSRYIQAGVTMEVSDNISSKLFRDYLKNSIVLDGLNPEEFLQQYIQGAISKVQSSVLNYYSSGQELPGGMRAALRPALKSVNNSSKTIAATLLSSASEMLERDSSLQNISFEAFSALENLSKKILNNKMATAKDLEKIYDAGIRLDFSGFKDAVILTPADFSPEKVSKMIWISVLDNRTTSGCRYLHGKRFDIGQGPIPPRHYNCRSNLLPYVRGVDYDRTAEQLAEDAGLSQIPNVPLSLEKYRERVQSLTRKSLDRTLKEAVEVREGLSAEKSGEKLRAEILRKRKDFEYLDIDPENKIFKK